MMTFGMGSFGWLGLLIWPALIAGIILVVVWAVGAGRGAEDEPLRELRSRFARGEIDVAQFEEMRRVLGASERPRTGARLGLFGLLLIVGALVTWIVASVSGSGGWNWGWGGMMGPGGVMGPGGMMGIGAGPTAPAGTSVRMAGTRFEPTTLTIRVGDTVRWFNDDALPHTVSAADGSWDLGQPLAWSLVRAHLRRRRQLSVSLSLPPRDGGDDRSPGPLMGERITTYRK